MPARLKPMLLCFALLAAPTGYAQQDPPIAVHFPQGARSTTVSVSGTLAPDHTAYYTLDVAAAQVIQLKVSGGNNVRLRLYAPGEQTPLNAEGDSPRFSGLLTTPGTYRIQVDQAPTPNGSEQMTHYTLSVALR